MGIETVMQNGARVIAEWKWRDRHLVCCEWHGDPMKYVTWSCIPHSSQSDKMSGYTGHYFDNEDEALKDLTKRINSVVGGFSDGS